MVQAVKRRKRTVFQLNAATVLRLMDVDDFLKLSVKETKVLRRCVNVLTDKQRDMLQTVADLDSGGGCTRSDLAEVYEDYYVVGGAPEEYSEDGTYKFVQRLSDYRIGLLRALVDAGLVVEYPRGKTFAYFVPGGVKAFLDDLERRRKEQVAKAKEAAAAAQDAAKIAPLQAALWARLTELALQQGVPPIKKGDGRVFRIDGKQYQNTIAGLIEVKK